MSRQKENVARCNSLLEAKYPTLVRLIHLHLPSLPFTAIQDEILQSAAERAKITAGARNLLSIIQFVPIFPAVPAICICAEQTFSEAGAKKKAFVDAFSAALDAYLASPMRDSVNKAIESLPPDYFKAHWEMKELADIVEGHRLRTVTFHWFDLTTC
jgi:hypothetical protein